jgi:hypothetical protein
MVSSVNPYSGSGYASPNIIVPDYSRRVVSTTQAETAAAIPSTAVGEFDPAVNGGAATASSSAMQAVLQLAHGGYDNASSGRTEPASGGAARYNLQGLSLDDGTQSTTELVIGDATFSGKLAAASSDNPIASIKALAGLAEELRVSERTGAAPPEAASSTTVRIDASPDSKVGKTYAVLQTLAQDGDRYIASAAKSLLSRITGVFSNGIIEFKPAGVSPSLLGVTTGKAAQALSRFADEQIFRLAYDMADGKSDGAGRSRISNALRAMETGKVVVIPTSSLPLSSQPFAGQLGLYKLLTPPNSAFIGDGAYTAIFPDFDGPAHKWT